MNRPTAARNAAIALSLAAVAIALGGCTTSSGVYSSNKYDYSAPAPTTPVRLNLAMSSGDQSGVTVLAKQQRRQSDPTTPAFASVPVLAE
ncbi:MAG: hypothetical protein K2X32_01560 [Phycisphaerales bacterium]|nr:hypothetical protein [Phycisphaerales bacterium]